MAEWPFVEYQTLAATERSSFSMGPFGSKITKENYVSTGVPVVRGVNLARGVFHDQDFVFINNAKADEIASANVKPGDLVFTHRGTIGQVSMIPRTPRYDRYVIGSSQVKTRLDESRGLPEFYYYWFQSVDGQASILANSSTVGVPGIATPLTSIRKLRVPRPPLSEQKAIAAALGALDDKIVVNELVTSTADALADSTFERATHTMPAIRMSRLVSPVLGGTPDRKVPSYWGPGIPWASAKDVVSATAGVISDTEEEITKEAVENTRVKEHPTGTVILTARGTVGAVARVTRPTASNQSCYAFLPGSLPPALLFHIVRAGSRRMLSVAHGTVFSTVNMKTFDHIEIPNVTLADTGQLEEELASLHRLTEHRITESRTLAALRDTLLPQLMSGKLRVRDAERIVEDAV